MVNELLGIQYNIAKANVTDRKVQNLASYINVDSLRAIHRTMDKNKASGIDKVTKEKYEQNLEENLENLVKRMKTGSYRPNPTRRVYIPKETKGKMRPLGISSYEDKLVESAIAQILEQIYEPKFYNESFGFRPNRNCHQAVREIIEMVQYRKTNYVVEADIRGFFDNVNHDWLMKMLKHDIADKRFLELIEKFLKAGIMENGKYLDSERGTPQGNGASPILANIYLHYVLDNWFDVIVKRQCNGECYLIRYADDTVIICKNKKSANHAQSLLQYIMGKLELRLHPVKTKIINMWDGTEGFDFLGLHHRRFSRINKKGNRYGETYQYPSKKAMKKMKRTVKESINQRYLLVKTEEELIKVLNPKITGWKNYYKTRNDRKWMRAIDWYILCSFCRWNNKKRQQTRKLKGLYATKLRLQEKGLQLMAA